MHPVTTSHILSKGPQDHRVVTAPPGLTSTLYDVIAALQTLVEPDEDDVIITIVADWLRSGRLSVLRNTTAVAAGGSAPWP
jgi:hypothetical protein